MPGTTKQPRIRRPSTQDLLQHLECFPVPTSASSFTRNAGHLLKGKHTWSQQSLTFCRCGKCMGVSRRMLCRLCLCTSRSLDMCANRTRWPPRPAGDVHASGQGDRRRQLRPRRKGARSAKCAQTERPCWVQGINVRISGRRAP